MVAKTRGQRIYSLEEQKDMLYNLQKYNYMPLKYSYFDYGAQRWIRFAQRWLRILKQDPGARGIHVFERVLLTEMIKSIFNSLPSHLYKNFNLIDLGCGDGSPMYPILRYLQLTMPKAKIRYNPIDLSPDLLSAASKNISRDFKVFGKPSRWDLESGSFSHITKGLNAPNFGNLYLFLGATFGNMYNQIQMLSDVKRSMLPCDYLLLAVELVVEKEIGTMVREYYDIREIYDLTFSALESFGLKRSAGEFKIIFNRKASQIECYYVPDKEMNLVTLEGKTVLPKREPVLLAISTKYTVPMITEIIEKAGFRICLLTTSIGNNYAMAMLQPMK
ncbi:MAG: L-histidine N(alpha)-methyltransferase [Candidatus Micrarchaeota archaeon]|nr:L-histidine N(alpha)-methyltransferase [Candidatus Micrarchaeota archaeon]MDE1847868.1 L-histidine N(alpha)-methyltransferase [Candidatus Micrarchaeota archaeon]MDE1864195.1 L-histidine N(alpha)-methyltransferase [Candidatus Micrarchaeota archaeon]